MGFAAVDIGLGTVEDFLLGDEDAFKVAYVFEIVDTANDNRPLYAHVLPVAPRVYRLSEPFAVTLTPTEDNTVVAEENGLIVRELTMEGTFGLRKRKVVAWEGAKPLHPSRAASIGETISKDEASGTQHFRALRNLFRRYSELKKDPAVSAFIQMWFHSLPDDDHFLVIPKVFETPRDSRTTRMHYSYRIVMNAIGGPELPFKRQGPPEETYGFWDAIGDISQAVQDTRAAFADTTALLDKIRRKVQNIDAIMLQVAGVITSVGSFIHKTSELFITTPLASVASAAEAVADACDQLSDDIDQARSDSNVYSRNSEAYRHLKRIEVGFNRIMMFPDRFLQHNRNPAARYQGETGLTESDLQLGTAGAEIGSRVRAVLGSGRESGLNLGSFRGVILYEVQRGDTLASLSNRFVVPQELLTLVNNLRAPYFSESGGPGIKAPGDQFLVPVSQGARGRDAAPSTTEEDYLTPEEALYGIDIALDQEILNRDKRLELKVDSEHDASDVALVRGLPNAIQGIVVIIYTEQGTTLSIPDIGIRRTVGEKGSLTRLILASLNLRDAILSDTNVEEIEALSLILDGDSLKQVITPRLIGKRNVSLSLPFGRARG